MVLLRRIFIVALILAMPCWSGADGGAPALHHPKVSGLFYPAEKNALSERINAFLKAAGKADTSPVVGLIVPHAGYDYSGKTAALAYSTIRNRPYRTVIILGPSHYAAFEGVAIYPSGAWETPLGRVAVDDKAARAIAERCPFARYLPAAFDREHSLEVQLPFLQNVLSGFEIVPVVMGRMGEAELSTLGAALAELVRTEGQRMLIVASSDMSHYHTYQEAARMDGATLASIVGMGVEGLTTDLERGVLELCGAGPVITLMMVARRCGWTPVVLGYANSGDVTGDKKRVVGYGSVAFTAPALGSLTVQEKKDLLALARKTLEAHVMGRALTASRAGSGRLAEKRGVFVTLQKGGALRGCIGYVKPVLPLADAVSQMTVSAASRDPRFPPVVAGELRDIHIEISVLSPLGEVKDVREIEIGKHGLFVVRGDRAGLLLPQVATENGWGRDEFLEQTCRKAGLQAAAWKDKDTAIYRFSAEIFSE